MSSQDLRIQCSFCGLPIDGGPDETWDLRFTAISNWQHGVTDLSFHEDCYQQGRMQLIKQVAVMDLPMGGEIRFDARERRSSMSKKEAIHAMMDERSRESVEWLKKTGMHILNLMAFAALGAFLSAAGGDGLRSSLPGVIAGVIYWFMSARLPGMTGDLLSGALFGGIIGWFLDDIGGARGAIGGALVIDALVLLYAAYEYVQGRLQRR